MNHIFHIKRIARLGARAVFIAFLSMTFGTNPAFAADNTTPVTSTLTGNWVNYSTVTTTNADGMQAITTQNIINAASGTVSTTSPAMVSAHGLVAVGHSSATNNGTVRTQGANSNGIHLLDYSTATNSGSITTIVSNSCGIRADGHSTAYSSGSISTNNSMAHGIYATDASTATNSGIIITSGGSAHGMYSVSNCTATNNGSISTHGTGSHGLSASTSSNVTNSGTISTYGMMSSGINISGGCTATNTGNISTAGMAASGLSVAGASTAFNSGSISTTGMGSNALQATGGSTVTNSGTLAAYGTGSHAVSADGGCSVHLQTGSRILAGDVFAAAGGARLYLDGSGTTDFDITGPWWQIHKTGTGTWTLAGAIAAPTDLNLDGGTLTLAKGVTVSTTGSYTQAAGTTLALTLNNSGGPYITAAGPATVAGTLALDVPCSALGSTQTIIDAATITGGFDSVSSGNPNFSFNTTVVDGARDQIMLTGVCYAPQYDNSSMGLSSAMGGAQTFLGVPSNRTIGLLSENQEMGEFMVASSEPLIDLVSRRSNGDRYGIYVQPMFNVSKRDAFNSGPGYSANMAGLEIGADTFVSDDLMLGVFAGYAVTDINFEGLAFAENDSEDQQMYTLGAYGGYRFDNWRLTDTLSVTHIEHESKRNAGLGEMAKGDYDSQMLSNQLLASYAWTVNETWELSPELGLNTTWLYRGGFSETDATNAAEYDDFDKLFVESIVGLRLRGNFEVGETTLSPYARLSWSHDLGGNDMTVRQTLGTSAAEATQENDDDRLGLDLGLSLREGDATFTLAYAGEFSDHSESHGLTANLRLEF